MQPCEGFLDADFHPVYATSVVEPSVPVTFTRLLSTPLPQEIKLSMGKWASLVKSQPFLHSGLYFLKEFLLTFSSW